MIHFSYTWWFTNDMSTTHCGTNIVRIRVGLFNDILRFDYALRIFFSFHKLLLRIKCYQHNPLRIKCYQYRIHMSATHCYALRIFFLFISSYYELSVTKGLSKNYVAQNVGMKSTHFSALVETLFSIESSWHQKLNQTIAELRFGLVFGVQISLRQTQPMFNTNCIT